MSTFTVFAEDVCVSCGTVHTFEVESQFARAFANGFALWQYHGVLIQDALPFLTAGQREILMTGVSDECWNVMFPAEDEE